MLHYATEKVSMHLIGRICSIRRFDFSSIIVEQLYISERKKKSCIRNRTQRTSNPRFQWKYSYHTDHSENPERPNSLNVLPMSQCCWWVGFFVSVNLSVTQGNWGEQ